MSLVLTPLILALLSVPAGAQEGSTREVQPSGVERKADKAAQDAGQRADDASQRAAEESAGQAGAREAKSARAGKGAKRAGKGPDVALLKQVAAAERRHRRRAAQLDRLRMIAEQKGDEEMLERIAALEPRNQEVYDRKMAQLAEKHGEEKVAAARATLEERVAARGKARKGAGRGADAGEAGRARKDEAREKGADARKKGAEKRPGGGRPDAAGGGR